MNIGNETEQIEFKRSTSELKEGVISIASILNKHGKGTLYFGVKDNGDIIGQEIGKDTLRNVSRSIAGNIEPSCWYSIEEQKTAEGDRFIEVQFSGDTAPYSAYGRYYERFADEDRMISDIELEKLFKSRHKNYSLWEDTVSDTLATDIDHNLFDRVIYNGITAGRIQSVPNYLSALGKLGLISSNKQYLNNAGKVLFSENKPIVLKLATFAGTTKETFTRLNHFEGNLYECIDEAIRYINESIDWKVTIGGDARRIEAPEIPAVAIREIVVNAFAHGKYDSNTTFEVDIFKDKVIVYSPGLFPIGFVPEDFADNTEFPIILNPKIVSVLFKTGEIESFGSGYARAFAACKESGISYSYENTKSGFRFVFYRPLGHINVYEMSKTEKKVFDEIKKNNMVTAKMIADTIGKSEKTVYRAISTLKKANLIEREGNDYNGSWLIK